MQKSSRQVTDSWLSLKDLNIEQLYGKNSQFEDEIRRGVAIANTICSIISDITNLFSRPVNWVAKKIERNRQRNELHALSDRMLADIGITRGQIDGLVDGTLVAYGRQSASANVDVLKQPKSKTVDQKQRDDMSIAA